MLPCFEARVCKEAAPRMDMHVPESNSCGMSSTKRHDFETCPDANRTRDTVHMMTVELPPVGASVVIAPATMPVKKVNSTVDVLHHNGNHPAMQSCHIIDKMTKHGLAERKLAVL